MVSVKLATEECVSYFKLPSIKILVIAEWCNSIVQADIIIKSCTNSMQLGFTLTTFMWAYLVSCLLRILFVLFVWSSMSLIYFSWEPLRKKKEEVKIIRDGDENGVSNLSTVGTTNDRHRITAVLWQNGGSTVQIALFQISVRECFENLIL